MQLKDAIKVGDSTTVTLKDGRKAMVVSKTWTAGKVTFLLRDKVTGVTYSVEHGDVK
jgi:hypothetical protein